jgi:hypothetical protein
MSTYATGAFFGHLGVALALGMASMKVDFLTLF